ncbi:MAG: hypothetical protein ACRD2Y_11010 [Terriglobales bacterium]
MKGKIEQIKAQESAAREVVQRLFGSNTTLEDAATAIQRVFFPPEVKKLHDLTVFFETEMVQSHSAGAQFSAILAAGAMIESLLLLFCFINRDQVEQTSVFRLASKPGRTFEQILGNWSLKDVIGVAEECLWVNQAVVDEEILEGFADAYREVARIADPKQSEEDLEASARAITARPDVAFLRMVQHLRNMVHGARWLRQDADFVPKNFEKWSLFGLVIAQDVRDSLLFRLPGDMRRLAARRLTEISQSKP